MNNVIRSAKVLKFGDTDTCPNCGSEYTIPEGLYTRFRYDITCKCCHKGNHIEVVKHCSNCEPVRPTEEDVLTELFKAKNLTGAVGADYTIIILDDIVDDDEEIVHPPKVYYAMPPMDE